MKAVPTRQKYKCDFCQRRSIKGAMERHERICFRNPNRFCDFCGNKGFTHEDYGEGMSQDIPCPYCSKRDLEMEKNIIKYESSLKEKVK